MWSITTTDLPRLGTYAEALRIYNKTAPWRGDADKNKRPLGNRRKHHMTFRQLEDGSIACKLYWTDVVTFHPDDTVTLVPHESQSTNSFANTLMGWNSGLSAKFPAVVVTTPEGRRVYRLKEATTFRREEGHGLWSVATPEKLGVWRDYYIDRAKAQKALHEYRYHEFVTWSQTRRALGLVKPAVEGGGISITVFDALKHGPEGGVWEWLDGYTSVSNPYYPQAKDRLIKQIYQHADCIRCTERQWIHLFEWDSILRRERKWG